MAELTYAQAINEGIREEMRRDPHMVVMGEDVGKYGGIFGVTRGLYDEFGGERVRDCPLNEAAIVGFCIGLALWGRPAVAELEFMDFVTFAMDPVVNQAAKLRYFWGGQVGVPLVVRTPIAAQLGFGSQHSQSLEAWFMHVPGLKVVMPATPYDAKGLIKTRSATATRCCLPRASACTRRGARCRMTITWCRLARPTSSARAAT